MAHVNGANSAAGRDVPQFAAEAALRPVTRTGELLDAPGRRYAGEATYFTRQTRLIGGHVYSYDVPLSSCVHEFALQTEEALERIASEFMEDMRNDGVVYVCDNSRGQSVLRGLDRGRRNFGVQYGLILCAMRNIDPRDRSGKSVFAESRDRKSFISETKF